MTGFQLFGAFTTLIALFGYINHRYLRLPESVGITAIGVAASLGLILVGTQVPALQQNAEKLVESLNFYEVVFHGVLPLLLFSGSLHFDVGALAKHKLAVLLLSTLAVGLSTIFVGAGTFLLFAWAGIPLALSYCLLFGALISPTDPIAVMGILKQAKVPLGIETKITGESLFNDGTAIVIFLTILAFTTSSAPPSLTDIAQLFLTEVLGAVVVGSAIGWLGTKALRQVHSYTVEIFTTLGMVTGGYALAEAIHAAAPLSVVIMGLVLGRQGTTQALCEETKAHLFSFWELADELLTLMLFGLIGVQVIALDLTVVYVGIGASTIAIVLLSRFVSVSLPLLGLTPLKGFSPHAVTVLTWGGLRGGVSIALALSLPPFYGKDLLLCATYFVVLFSILIQSTTLGPLLKKLGY
ncbi:MAG: sodium:proton antiporter [Agitococcus sp.]|nr:sodium:proton antiporter [Agitococcus sp.]MDO9179219.1 sodium:proton antiporter [Agitococcus sp.]